MSLPDPVVGFCQCGCGEETYISREPGVPNRFLHGHNARKEGHCKHSQGYVTIFTPSHPRAMSNGCVFEHILVCEKVLGKPLPPGAVPHHSNGDKKDNQPKNLVVCQDQAYHNLLHRRARAYAACGRANWIKCQFCKKYDDPKEMFLRPGGRGYHKKCQNIDRNRRRKSAKSK